MTSTRERGIIVTRTTPTCSPTVVGRRSALNDTVVQRLASALLALDLGRVEDSREHVERALKASQEIISELLRGDHGEATLGPGDLADGGTER